MKEKIKKFYNSDLYIKIIYGIPALVSGGFAFILLSIFTIQIIPKQKKHYLLKS